MTAAIVRADARALPLADASVDLIVTSPPYYQLRAYSDGGAAYGGQIGAEPTPAAYVAALLDCTREWMRVLKPTGSLFVNLGDKYSPRKSALHLPERYRIGCVDQLGLIARATIAWSKPNPIPEGAVTDRVQATHEDVVHLVKMPHYFAAMDTIRLPHTEPGGRPGYGRSRPVIPGGNRGMHVAWTSLAAQRDMGQHRNGKLPGSVWEIAAYALTVPAAVSHGRCCGGSDEQCVRGIRHDATFPPALVRRIVLGWSPPGGLVLDPFGGTGTTALVADVHGRRGISVDRSADYCRLARWRTTDPGERARALGVPKPPPVLDGQMELL